MLRPTRFLRQRLAAVAYTATLALALLGAAFAPTARAQGGAAGPPGLSITPFSTGAGSEPPSPWRFATLPHKSATRFELSGGAGERVLRVEADQSYGTLVHPLQAGLTEQTTLAWRWKVDQFVQGADLRSRAGDDGIAKLCVFFDFPAARLPVGERVKLALARSATGEDVPAETLCYVWDGKEGRGALLVNAFTDRMRMVVLEFGPSTAPGGWVGERRALLADYRRAFGGEAGDRVPEVLAVAVSADADNTHGHGLAFYSDIVLRGAAPVPGAPNGTAAE